MKQLAARLGFRLSALALFSLFSIATLLGIGASISRSYAESEKMGAAQAMGREKYRAQIRSERGARALSGNNHSPGVSSILSPPPVVSITVDRTDDAPLASTCTVAPNDCSLRGAVTFANILPATTIIVPAGTYQLTIGGGSEGFSGNNNIGDLDVSQSNTSIVGAGAASTIIQQASGANDRVIEVNPNLDSSFNFSISGVTIKGGKTPDGGGGIISGSFNNSTTVTNCVFDGNQATNPSSPGGAIWNIGGGNLTVSGSTFVNNSATHSSGGAITMDNFGGGNLNLTVTNSSFTNNTTGANSGGGGAIAIIGTGGFHSISTSSFVGNSATHPNAGGGAIFSSNTGGTLNARFNRFFNNTAAVANGKTLRRTGGGFTANDNWWGINTGPGAGHVSGLITLASWLQLRISASPDNICPNASSTLTADIFGRNTGTPANPSDLVGLPPFPATFSTAPPNTVSPTTTNMVNGQATSTFTAVNAVGSADADVTADNETETVTITINNTTASALSNANACTGQSASFSTTAGGTGPFTFVWKKGATVLNNGDLGGRVTINSAGNTSTLTISNVQGTDAGTYTVEVTTACETVSQSASLTIDPTAPTITAPADAAYQCASSVPAADPSQATANDNCGAPTVTVSESNNGGAGTTASPLVITRTYTATDANGNTASDSQTITVIDNTAPTVTAPADSSASADASCQAAIPNVIAGSTSSDNCGGTVTLTQSPAAGTLVGFGPHTITVTATDTAGNTSSDTVTFTVNDTTAPTVSAPADAAYQCASNVPAASPSQATASDNCGTPTVTVTETNNGGAGSVSSPLIITRTYTATDASNNAASDSQTITVIDNTAPTVTAPADSSASGDAACQAAIPNLVAGSSASDNCGGTVTLTQSPAAGTLVGIGPHTVTVTATDAAGNTSSDTATFTVNDTTAPTVSAPAASSASANANCQAAIPNVVAGSSSADNCGTVTLTQSPAAGTLVGIGPHTIMVTATDAAGNTSSDSTTFTVNDTTAPAVSAPADAAYQCASNVPAANASQATASDNCGTATVAVSETNNGGAGTTSSPLVITRTYTATDGSGNTSSDSQTITVIDNTAPSVTAPADSSAAADASCQAAIPNVIPGSSSSDNCGGTVTLTQSPAAGTLVGVGPHTITVTATDAAGNSSSDTTTFTVTDTTAPTLTLNGPNPMTVECHTVFTDPGATASDACAGNLTGSIVVTGSVNANAVGSYTLTYTVSDGVNTTTKTRVVNVVDTTAPVITLNGANPLTVSCQATFTDPGATATDSCAGSGQATASSNVNLNVPGTYTITYTASDASGNAATPVTRTVIVADTGAPVINLSGTPISLWPPNHDYHTVNVSSIVTSVSDSCSSGGGLSVSNVVITKVTSDEAENGNGDGNTMNDIVIAANCKSVQLRSERDGSGNGRVYTIYLKVKDAANNVGTATFKVTVPKNQGGTAIDSGPVYTKTSSCP